MLAEKLSTMVNVALDLAIGSDAESRGMKCGLGRFFIGTFLAMVWAFALVNAAAQTNAFTSTEFKLPILTVSQNETGKWGGQIIQLDLTVTKTGSDRPLLVAVAEDRPNGVGEQFRAAMWSSASTLALERGTPMRGYLLELTAEEAVDGPSAGAMITLALMTAVDGKALTNDFVFTGTILPNGNVGHVGGLVQKIEAAKAAGKSRVFVPAYCRTDKDLNTGEAVDLKEKCRSLGLRMIPVANIRQAYALINNVGEIRDPAASLELPDAVEDVLVKLYRRELTNSSAAFDTLSLEQKQMVTNTTFLKKPILDLPQQAEQSYRGGNLPSAFDHISDVAAWIEAFIDTERFLTTSSNTNLSTKELFAVFDKEIAGVNHERMDALNKHLSFGIATNDPALAQFDDFAVEISMFGAMGDFLDNSAQDRVSKAEEAPDLTQKNAFDLQARLTKYFQLMVSYAWQRSRTLDDFSEFANLFKGKTAKATSVNRAIEQLLFNTMEAAFNAYTATTIKTMADEHETSADSIVRLFAANDLNFLQAQQSRATSERMRQIFKTDQTLYMLICQSRSHARALAQITDQSLKDDLEADEDDAGNTRYGNVALLQGLLQSAREEALAAIARCQKAGVPCWEPIAAVHIADAERDDPEKDKMHDVFQGYFVAALDAKILTLMCSQDEKENDK
jgi:hypothetical protein